MLSFTDTNTRAVRNCHGCGKPLPDQTGPGRRRKWCDNNCRRRTRYSGSCVDCGATTYNGTSRPPERCHPCAVIAVRGSRKTWTREALIAAIQEWAELHGEPPRITNWNPTHATAIGHPEFAAEYQAGATEEGYNQPGRWPGFMSVVREFGSWNAGIVAAGFKPRRAHHRWEEADRAA